MKLFVVIVECVSYCYLGFNLEKGLQMVNYQFVYFMDGVFKIYLGGKKVFENICLNFLFGVKIGVVGVNGVGKLLLLKIMVGMDKDF